MSASTVDGGSDEAGAGGASPDEAAMGGASASDDARSLGAVILAGGLARRMGGVDKGLVPLGGQPMIAHVMARVRPAVDALVINANRNEAVYAALGAKVVADHHPGHLGPLAGLAAGLAALDTARVLLCPCDSPFIATELVARLDKACAAAAVSIAVAHDGERLQPVFAVVDASIAPSLDAYLSAGERKIDRWYAGEAMQIVDCSDLAGSFRNINTEAERSDAEARLAEHPAGDGA